MKIKWKISFNAPVVLGFAGICVIAFVLNIITGGQTNSAVFMTYHSALTNPMTYVRFITHVFGHGSWEHLIGNMSYLLLLGPLLEEKYGTARMIQVIIITAAVTGIINYVFFWNTALCGASGVCFAFILLSSFTRFKEGEIPLTFILVALIFLGGQIYDAIAVQDNISNMAHILGGVVGAAIGYSLNKHSKYSVL